MRRGVVLVMLVAGIPCACDTSSEQLDTSELLENLFSDTSAPLRNNSYAPFRPLELEDYLDESPEIAKQFKELSLEDQDTLVEAIDIFNDAFSQALYSFLASLDLSKLDNNDCTGPSLSEE